MSKMLEKRLSALEVTQDQKSIVGAGPAKVVWRRPGETTEEACARGGGGEEGSALVFYWPNLRKEELA